MKKVFAILVISCLSCCHPDEPLDPSPGPQPKCWEKFVGNYIVSDTANNITYNMNITHTEYIEPSGNVLDSLIITNYANRFNLKVGFGCRTDPNILRFSPPYPSKDHWNKRWSFTINTDDSTTSIYENRLTNDTMVLYYRLNNIAFYFSDSVAYYAADEKHIAVKQ